VLRRLAAESTWLGAATATGASFTAPAWHAKVSSLPWPAGSSAVMSPGQYVGDSYVQMGGALATYAVGRLTDSPTVARIGSALFRSQVLAEATSDVLKLAAHRTRPASPSLSFPSSHSA